MKTFLYPDKKDWTPLLQRSVFDATGLQQKVRPMLEAVKQDGDVAIAQFTAQFDGITLSNTAVSQQEFEDAIAATPDDLKVAIQQAADNIRRFHEQQVTAPVVIETMPGIKCWRKSVGIEKVGLYIPGGTAPLFSTILMLGIPAALAGCKEVILCTPPSKDGTVHPAILFAAQLVGISKVFKIGGVQAIAAMAYGTATVPKVYKIFGPGNQYVTCAKQLIQEEGIAIDMPAGPSEVCVLADESANADFVAADLLSQVEHGIDSEAILITWQPSLVDKVLQSIDAQLTQLPRRAIATQALDNSKIFVVENEAAAIAMANAYAAEHLIIASDVAEEIATQITNAGSIFLGHYSPESVGDYASGTNHTLPTNGYAKAYSGVSVDSFVKKITFQQLSQQGLQNIGSTVEIMAAAEGLDAHKQAVTIRLNTLK
jgi:histidinol dehydrogenase